MINPDDLNDAGESVKVLSEKLCKIMDQHTPDWYIKLTSISMLLCLIAKSKLITKEQMLMSMGTIWDTVAKTYD